ASQLKQEVILIEKNPSLGRKLLLTGKGRCNLTNLCDLEEFLKKFPRQKGGFLRTAFKKFFQKELIRFFEERNLKLKIERQKRVFPVSDRAKDVLKVLEEELKRNKVKIMLSCCVEDLLCENKEVKGVILKDKRLILADKVILACGGLSFSFTGSSGDGFRIAGGLGHTITPLRPALVPLETEESFCKELQGLTLRNIRIKFISEKERLLSEVGELLFTHFGVSGPLVLDLSGKVVDWLEEKREVFIEIDLKPALSTEKLESRFLREFFLYSNRSIKRYLESLLPRRMINSFLHLAQILPQKKLNQITRQERQRILFLLKRFRLKIKRPLSIEEAMITQGGVSLREVDPSTMQSRLIKGLYFAGEILDASSTFSGGFNLQMAFSTGYLAGESASLN
ncbi:MAG: NAD(P)/FAD-dependent oxidoreductase, partial [Candidatus Omnitrophica bacterium]|nr:NAD(P)/FAD-dependent oxidoreductase [Candidatus Omnitrophota bacterium]